MKLLVITILSIFSFQSYLQAAEPTDGLSASRKVFLDAMENPIVAENFHAIQLELLMSPADQEMDNLFKNQAVLSQFYNLLMSHQDDILKGFVRSSLTGRVQLVRGLAPYYDTLDALVVKTMADLGFTKEAIANRKIFIQSGTMNAFTVSGSSRQVIVVFNHDILEKMSLAQVAGVLTHELGHVRAGHTIKGMMNNIFLNLVTKLFTKGTIKGEASDDDFDIHALTKDVIDSTMEMSQKIIELNTGDEESIAVSTAMLTTKTLVEKKFQSELMDFINEFLSPQMRPYAIKTIREFLQLTVDSMVTMKADPMATNQFRILYNNLNIMGVLKLDAKTLSEAAQLASMAQSKAFETTADNISASGQRSKNLSAGLLKLAGLDFGKEDREGIFKRILEQAKQFSSTYDPKEDFRYLGSSHPAIILRTARMLNIPAYPSIAFANPFMRNLLLAQQLRSNAMVQEKILLEKRKSVNLEGKTPEEVQEIQKALDARTKFVEDSLKAATQFEDQVLALLNDGRLLNDRSPRFENFVQFMSTQKEITLNGIASLEDSLASAPAEQVENIKAMIADDKAALDYQDILLKKELRLLIPIPGARKLGDILTQLLAATTEEQVAKIRASVTQSPEMRPAENYYSARIPLDLQLTPPTCQGLFAK